MKKYNTFFTHLLFWVGYITVAILTYGYGHDDWLNTCIDTTGSHIISAGIFYTTSSYSLPRLYAKKRYTFFALSLLLILGISVAIRYYYPIHLYPILFHKAMVLTSDSNELLLRKFFFQWFMFSLYAFFYWRSTVDKNKSKREKLELELAALRAQINPHFILNTLNRLSYMGKSTDPELSAAITWFTRILMSGISVPNSEGKVFLSIETDAVQGTIYMFKLRFPSLQLKLSLEVDDADRYMILPHILLPFVENALKYGVYDDPCNPIQIDLRIDRDCVRLKVLNKKSEAVTDTSNGIGTKYIAAQLEAGYPQNYHLNIKETDVTYSIDLSVKLI